MNNWRASIKASLSLASFCFVAVMSLVLLHPQTAASATNHKTAVAKRKAVTPQEQVQEGKYELSKGHIDSAIDILSQAAKTLGTAPGSCDCHYNLGKAFCAKAKKQKAVAPSAASCTYRSAKKELRTAIRVGRGNVISKQANEFLIENLPAEVLAPKVGAGTEQIASKLGLSESTRAEGAAPKAKVYEFYATWCEPCKQLKQVIAQIMKDHGEELELKSFDVDDDSVQEIVDQYEVSPIPTIIYLTPEMRVVGYSIGFNDQKNVEKQLAKILKKG